MKEKRRKVTKTFVINYGIDILKKTREILEKPVPLAIAALILDFTIIILVWLFGQNIVSFAPQASLQVLASIVESSATIFGIFFQLFFILSKQDVLK